MMYLETQEWNRDVFRADMRYGIYMLLVSAVLVVGIISIARPAQAQGVQYSEGNMQRPNSNASFGTNFPFGYGGGPRVPTPPMSPNAAVIVSRVIASINSILNRLFNR